MPEWTKDRPTEEGFYFVWQPQPVWPCEGEVHIVRVLVDIVVRAFVPYMDYADPISYSTWSHSWWMGPIELPKPPEDR
jgi:hypothetical protein